MTVREFVDNLLRHRHPDHKVILACYTCGYRVALYWKEVETDQDGNAVINTTHNCG